VRLRNCRPNRRRGLIFLVLSGTVVALGVYVLRPSAESDVERALRTFREDPCEATADPLLRLLLVDGVTQEEGTRILGALLEPRIAGNETFAPGEGVRIRIVPRHSLGLLPLVGRYDNVLFIDGITPAEGVSDSASLLLDSHLSMQLLDLYGDTQLIERFQRAPPVIRIDTPGTYRGRVELSYALYALPGTARVVRPSLLKRAFARIGLGTAQREIVPVPKVTYRCGYRLPVQIRVAGPPLERGAQPDADHDDVRCLEFIVHPPAFFADK
jgi:hypothetical protein